jgi:DNA mismatch repair ATPase MutS
MVELGFIRSGEFFEAYGESAFTGADEPDHRVSTDAHGCSMTGFPVEGLGTLMERMKSLGLSFANVQQMGDSARRGR